MRLSSSFTSLLLLLLLCGTTYGARFHNFTNKLAANTRHKSEDSAYVQQKTEIEPNSSKGRMQRGASDIANSKRSNWRHGHWFPWVHEDYYGPYRHKPKHH
ncbi:hypothetical protein RND81_07G114100 [Saponaria officinalis]|uniref:Uncharacterized protein n=1 Tax=Saponaria officinalis TaxID=3572 RepID=A0AAW1JQR4_SAPOF